MNCWEIFPNKRLRPGYAVRREIRKVKLKVVGLGVGVIFHLYMKTCAHSIGYSGPKVKLHKLGKINNYFISSNKIKMKLQENGKPLAMTHAEYFF